MSIKTVCRDIYLAARGFLLKLIGVFLKKPDLSAIDVKSILAIRIDRIGDLVVTLPGLKVLRNVFPSAKIAVLTTKENAALLSYFPWIDEAIAYRGFMKTAQLLRKKGFDLAVDFLMDYPVKTALLAYLSKAKFTAGFNLAERGNCFNLGLNPASGKKHVSLYMLDLVRAIAKAYTGKERADEDPAVEFLVPRQNRDYAESLLRKNAINKGDFVIVIHPGGHYISQCWPMDRFAKLADKLMEKYRAKIIILGSPKEKQSINRSFAAMKEEAIKAIGLTLDKVVALISLADLFIGDNSGPLHLAVALGIPTVSTMGPTDPVLWWPRGENHIVIRKALACSPCGLAVCPRHDCMKAISMEDIMEAAEAQVAKIKKS